MGQCIHCPCDNPGADTLEDLDEVILLDDVVLNEEEGGDILSELKSAIALQNDGQVTQAMKVLELAMDSAKNLPPTSVLSKVLATDPQIQLLVEKIKMSSQPTKTKRDEATAEQIQQSVRRASAILAPGESLDDALVESLTEKMVSPPQKPSKRSSIQVASEMTQGLTLGQMVDGRLTNPIPALQTKLAAILFLCDKARIFEAAKDADELELLVESIQQLVSAEPEVGFQQELDDWMTNFRLHTKIVKLRNIHSRLRAQLEAVRYEGAEDGTDKRWVQIHFTDPEITPTFEVNLWLRRAEGSEIDSNGPSTQLYVFARISSTGLSLTQEAAVMREVDLLQPSFFKAMKHISGVRGGADQLSSSMIQIVEKTRFGFFENQAIREFAKCDSSPFKGLDTGPGILILQHSLPTDVSSFEGWIRKPSFPTAKPQTSKNMTFISTASKSGKANCSDIYIFWKVSLPIPQWLLPLTLVRSLLTPILTAGFKKGKQNLVNPFQSLGFNERIKDDAAFYAAFQEMERAAGKHPVI
mmetsp:Transcript_82177/g.145017  ORF Transcript_82177/g.145017 Transcript_82177/m.145017 type:complete len:527 (-) Transcript_82177:63-1643(-)